MLPVHQYQQEAEELVNARLYGILENHNALRIPNHHPVGFILGPLILDEGPIPGGVIGLLSNSQTTKLRDKSLPRGQGMETPEGLTS